MTAIPNAFGAICLNPAGLEALNAAKPFRKFFEVFTSADHVRCLLDDDIATLLGGSLDELIRHHPTLKDDALEGIVHLLERIVVLGQMPSNLSVGDDAEMEKCPYQLHILSEDEAARDVKMVESDVKNDDMRDPLIALFVEIAARVSEHYEASVNM
jgi:E3 ubiquitin-protein ligase HUWE1